MQTAYGLGVRHVDHLFCAMSNYVSLRSRFKVPGCAMEAGTAIPCRFCTVLRTDHDVRQLLMAHQERILNTLSALDGTQEWGVKIFAAPIRPAADWCRRVG